MRWSEYRSQPVLLGLSAVLFLFPCLILLYKGSYNLTAGLLLLGSLAFCGWHRRILRLDRDDRMLLTALLAYPVVLMLAVLVQGGKWGALDYPCRVLALIPIVLCLRALTAHRLLSSSWAFGWLLGSLLAGGVALYLVFWQGWIRVGSQITNEIPYGQIAAILALGCFLFLGKSQTRGWQLLCVLSGTLATFALAVSGTRGAWLGLVVGGLFCGAIALRWNLRRFLLLLMTFSIASVFSLQFSQSVQDRLSSFGNDVRAYADGSAATSTGVRLDLWLLSVDLAKQQPLFGVGPGNFKEALAPKLGSKPYLANYSHAHSQYFDTLANAGLIGLAALLLSFLLPLYLFWQRVRSRTAWSRCYALQGCALIVCSMVASLTQPLYAHNISVIFYVICLSVCWALSSPEHDHSGSSTGVLK